MVLLKGIRQSQGAGQLGIERAFDFSRPRSNVGIEIGFRNGKTEWTKKKSKNRGDVFLIGH